VHAGEMCFAGFAQVEVAEVFPDGDRGIANQRLLNFAKASDKLRQPAAGEAVGQQEVEIFAIQKTMYVFA